MAVKVRFTGQGKGVGSHQIGHRGGVVTFRDNEAIVPDSVFQEWNDEGYPVEKVENVDLSQEGATNYFAYHGPAQVAASEKEMLSKQNVGDFHGLGTDVDVEAALGHGAVFNHGDTPVNIVNQNSALDQVVRTDYRFAPNRAPLVEMTDEEKERVKAIRATAAKIRKTLGVPQDETNALERDFPTSDEEEGRAEKLEAEDAVALGEDTRPKGVSADEDTKPKGASKTAKSDSSK